MRSQHSHAIAYVLQQASQPSCPADISAHLFHPALTAKSKEGLSSCFLRTEAPGDQVTRVFIQVKAQFFFEVRFSLPSAKQSVPPRHLAPPSDILRIMQTASVSRSQPAASASSCARPFRVRR